MSRWKAALIHLCISAAIAAAVSALLLLVWYPPPYFRAGGGGHLLMVLVGVDVTLGPLITLIIFRHGKPGLKFDLVVIGIVQAVALAYGCSVIVRTRPVFLVAAVDRFVLVDANQIAAKDLARAAQPQWRRLSWTGPVLVGSELPTDPKKHNALLFTSLSTGKDVQDFPEYYVPYANAAKGLLARAQPIAALRKLHPDRTGYIDDWLRRHRRAPSQVAWVPIQARQGDLTMLLDATNGAPLGAVALDPWPIAATPATPGSPHRAHHPRPGSSHSPDDRHPDAKH